MKNFDVAIIGGGVIGAAIGFELAQAKLRVGVLDRQEPGREASWAAAGMLSPSPHKPVDAAFTPLGNESLKIYRQFIESIESRSHIQTNFRRSGALEIFTGDDAEVNCRDAARANKELGVECEAISAEQALQKENALHADLRAALWLPDEATIEPRLLFNALLEAAILEGVAIRSNSSVTSLLFDGTACIGIVADSQRIYANTVVVAAGCFCEQIADASSATGQVLARYAPTHPVRGQLLSLRPSAVKIGRSMRSRNGYLVPRADGRIVAGSTLENAGFEKQVTAEGIREILDGAAEIIPELSQAEILESWSGLRPGTPDGLPILGPTDISGLLVATGHYRNGILLAPVTAKLVREWITTGKTSLDVEAFSPLRFAQKNTHPTRR